MAGWPGDTEHISLTTVGKTWSIRTRLRVKSWILNKVWTVWTDRKVELVGLACPLIVPWAWHTCLNSSSHSQESPKQNFSKPGPPCLAADHCPGLLRWLYFLEWVKVEQDWWWKCRWFLFTSDRVYCHFEKKRQKISMWLYLKTHLVPPPPTRILFCHWFIISWTISW